MEFEHIRQVKKRVEGKLLKYPGVTGVDIGYRTIAGKRTDTLAIIVYVRKKEDVPKAMRIPSEIEGIPTDVVQRTFQPHA